MRISDGGGVGATDRTLGVRRLRSTGAVTALSLLTVTAIVQSLSTVVTGHMAAAPSWRTLWVLAACLVGSEALFSTARIIWIGVVNRAEGRLRADLLSAALHQPLVALAEQASGEILDRVDDDTHALGGLVRLNVWLALWTVLSIPPMWVIAGLTWTPAWLLYPFLGYVIYRTARPRLKVLAELKIAEERAWTDHAAGLEEAIAARDDLRTSLGQPFAVRRLAQLSAVVHARLKALIGAEARLVGWTTLLLHVLLISVAVVGAALASRGQLSIAALVTLFMVTAGFVGQVGMLLGNIPELQKGLGSIARLKELLEAPAEPVGGAAPTSAPMVAVEFRHLDFQYPQPPPAPLPGADRADDGPSAVVGSVSDGDPDAVVCSVLDGDPDAVAPFALRDVTLTVPPGQTLALVGRTGSGKTTLAALISRAMDPPRGTVFLGGQDVCDLDLERLRAEVGVVTQRTELLAGTLAQNITLFADAPPGAVENAVTELGLDHWVAGFPQGLETVIGPGGLQLSAGEQQLVALARLLVRDVRVVVLDEATARMDPVTESRVIAASGQLLRGRTGVIIAHRLTTIENADLVATLDAGRVVEFGSRAQLAAAGGGYAALLRASSGAVTSELPEAARREDSAANESPEAAPELRPNRREPRDLSTPTSSAVPQQIGSARRAGPPPAVRAPKPGAGLVATVGRILVTVPRWGLFGAACFFVAGLVSAQGVVPGYLWGRVVQAVSLHEPAVGYLIALGALLALNPLALTLAIWIYPRWWVEVVLRSRLAVLIGQTGQHRLPATPPGEVVARAMDNDRLVFYADNWFDVLTGLCIATVAALVGNSPLAGLVVAVVMAGAASAAWFGRSLAGRTATTASGTRAAFGRSLVAALDAARTVKLAARTSAIHAHLRASDEPRVRAAIREHRVRALLELAPFMLIQLGVVTAWLGFLRGVFNLPTALLITNTVLGFTWFGMVSGSVVREAPGTANWLREVNKLADGRDLLALPEGVNLSSGTAPAPSRPTRLPLVRLDLRDFGAIHDDGTRGVTGVDLQVRRGELVLLAGAIGSGKSSLLAALAGLVHHEGELCWNGAEVADTETFCRPPQVAYVAQVPRVISGTLAENVLLHHPGDLATAFETARMARDVAEAGGAQAAIGHRGLRLSGGQAQRLALARALATESELLVADDVSSALDANTELELWRALRERGTTVIGASAKAAAFALADTVVVIDDGRVCATGPWEQLRVQWSALGG